MAGDETQPGTYLEKPVFPVQLEELQDLVDDLPMDEKVLAPGPAGSKAQLAPSVLRFLMKGRH